MKLPRVINLFAALAAALATDVSAADPPKCKLVRIDEWTVKAGERSPVLDGFINGYPIRVLIDTGMAATEGAILQRAAARRLGIPLKPYPGREFAGVGGETQAAIGFIREIRIGQATRANWQVMVGGEDHGDEGLFILGTAFFQSLDVEFDLSRDKMRLFANKDCSGASLAYWNTGSAGEARIWIEHHLTVTVTINGKPVRAVLDSGATSSVIDMARAARLGVKTDTPGTVRGPCFRGFGKNTVESWIGQFETFAIGNEVIRNPKMYFADLTKDLPTMRSAFFRIQKYELPEMLLGADFLRTHRVLVSRSHGKLFFSYEGGTVFPTDASAPCKK